MNSYEYAQEDRLAAKLLKKVPASNQVTIVDVGCGNGDMLRRLADFGFQNNLNLQLMGSDANRFPVN